MARMIIDYPDDMDPGDALLRVKAVASKGHISTANGIPHFCWLTSWTDGSYVATRTKRRGQKSDSLVVSGPADEDDQK